MVRSTFKVLFYVNGNKEKDGIVLIMVLHRSLLASYVSTIGLIRD